MATIAIGNTIDVIGKYSAIVTESLGTDSVYIRTKETLTELVTNGDLSSADKAKVISDVMSNINNSLVNASINTALNWAKEEKDNEFKKKELEYQLDVLEQQKLVEAARASQVRAEVLSATATSRRINGIATVDSNGFVTGLSNEGKLYNEIQLVSQQVLNAQEEQKVLQGRVRESQASVYKMVADTAANFGDVTYTLTDAGCDATINIIPGTLAYEQTQIAKQQAKGYAYNAWANAVNSAASTIGMLVAENIKADWVDTLQAHMNTGLKHLVETKAPE